MTKLPYEKVIILTPTDVSNNEYYDLMKSTVTEHDIQNGTNLELFALHELILWAIKHKTFINYYDECKRLGFDGDIDQHEWVDGLTKNRTVIHNGQLVFGLVGDDDGDNIIVYPKKDGLYRRHL